MRKILPIMVSWFTRKPRYFPEIEWSKESWTHNFFRFFEMIFGREYGIRAEVTGVSDGNKTTYVAHTFEGACSIFEQSIRLFLKNGIRIPLKIWIPKLSSPMGLSFPTSPYLFAIAFDNAANNGGVNAASTGGTISMAFTCTGSNLVLISDLSNTAGGISGATCTYNAVSMTQQVSNITTPTHICFDLTAPATGSHTLTYNGTASNNSSVLIGVSLTGCAQSSEIGVTSSITNSATSITNTVTTTTNNSMIIDFVSYPSTQVATAGGSQTQNTQLNYSGFDIMSDASSRLLTTTAGSYSTSWSTATAASYRLVSVEVKPFVASGLSTKLLLMGVGAN